MNIKIISLAISLIIISFIGGYIVIYDNTPNESNGISNFNNTTTVPDVANNLSVPSDRLPPSIEKTGEYSYNINKDLFIENHTSIIEAQSVSVLKNTDEYNKTVKKSGDIVYINNQRPSYKVEKYQTVEFTFSRIESGNVEYDAKKESLDKNNYNFNTDLELYLKSLELNKIRLTEEDDILVHMTGSNNLEALATTLNFESIDNADALVTVNQDGLVKNIKVTVVGTSLGSKSSKTLKYNVRDLSDTNINEPNWVQNARDTTSIVRATLSNDDNIIKISHEGLSTIRPNTNITIVEEESNYNISVGKEVGRGDDIFLAPTESGWDASINNINVTGSRDISGRIDSIYYKYNGDMLFNMDF